jgi:hypothetical protein
MAAVRHRSVGVVRFAVLAALSYVLGANATDLAVTLTYATTIAKMHLR